MSGRANLLAGASPTAQTDDVAAAAPLTAILVTPRADGAAELAPMMREAMPDDTVVVCASAGEALGRAAAAQVFGRTAALFVFDFRGMAVGDLVGHTRQTRKAHPDAEFIIVVDQREAATVMACLQVAKAPSKITFLMAPLRGQETAAAIRSVGARYRALTQSSLEIETREARIGALESANVELQARLDIALHAARHDSLTGILNRIGFVDELAARLVKSRVPQTVLLIDLDRFKLVNDTLGHDAGDELVRRVCTALQLAIPASGVLARLGGDEFGVIIESASDTLVDEFCSKLLRLCGQTRRVAGHEVQVSASIGVAHQGELRSQVELMRHADLALNAAKREGRNRYRVYDTAIDREARRRHTIERGLERALNGGQFTMAYQPIVKAEDGKVQGFEALIRWNSSEHGVVSPSEFVPIAEDTGLILELGDWITRQALRDCRKWGGPYVSINLSGRQFLRNNVAERILRFAEDAEVAPERIQIELTETAIIDNVERADENLRRLRGAGARVALDDFGTGYSSLVYLNRFAIDCIKIDKSFVDNITTDRQSAVIVASVAKLAASLGMAVVAEGVETEAQRDVLIAAGCGALQGFHFGRPLTSRQVIELLERQSQA